MSHCKLGVCHPYCLSQPSITTSFSLHSQILLLPLLIYNTSTPNSPLGNTLRAHRLTQHAWSVGGQDAQQAVIKGILRAAFEEDKDIGDINVLASIALRASAPTEDKEVSTPPLFEDENSARAWIASSSLEAEVRNQSANAAARGVSGVPCAVVNGRWVLAGCLAPQCYFKLFEKIATGHCSGTCPSLQNGGDNKTGTTCSKAPTVLKADAGTMCGLTGSPETICTPSAQSQIEAKKTFIGEAEVASPPSVRSAAPTAVAI